MKVVIFSGSHPRHLFIHSEVLKNFDVVGAVVMERESLVPTPPEGVAEGDKKNFIRHFKERDEVETSVYGTVKPQEVFKDTSALYIGPDELNSEKVADYVKSLGADCCFVFGCDIIKDPVFSILPEITVNLHLGLSPWYKGSATLFWPFYNLEPQEAGFTLHYLTKRADEGAILHTARAPLKKGDGIHDVGARVVEQARIDVVNLLEILAREGRVEGKIQKTSGRLYLTNSFIPEHLRVIYDLYDNNIVDEVLEKGFKVKKLFSVIKD